MHIVFISIHRVAQKVVQFALSEVFRALSLLKACIFFVQGSPPNGRRELSPVAEDLHVSGYIFFNDLHFKSKKK